MILWQDFPSTQSAGNAVTKLEALQAIHEDGLVRQRATCTDFEAVLAIVDQLEHEGLVEGVYRRALSTNLVDFVKVIALSVRGVAYVKAMSEEEE